MTSKYDDFAKRIKDLRSHRAGGDLRWETAATFDALLSLLVMENAQQQPTSVESLQTEVTDLRRQKTDLETALASTMTAWHKDKAALEAKVADLQTQRDAAQRAESKAFFGLDDARAKLDAATRRVDLAEATLKSVRAAVAKPAEDRQDGRPKVGDSVPWSEMSDGLYHRPDYPYPFAMVVGSRVNVVDHDDRAVARMLDGSGRGQLVSSTDPERVVFVARDLGTDPEVWRAAMREHMAKVGK